MTHAGVSGEVGVLRVRPPGVRSAVAASIPAIVVFTAFAVGVNDYPAWVRILFAVLVLLLAATLPLTLRSGIVAGPVGLVAYLPTGRARRLDWVDIHHVELRGYWRGLGVWTTDERWVRLFRYGTFDRAAADILFRLDDHRRRSQHRLGLV